MSNEREVFERTLTRLLIEQHKPDFERFGFEYMDGDTLTAHKMFLAGAEWQRSQAQPADALVEALELLYRKLTPNVNGADETYFFIGLRDQVTERQMEQISEALATYRAAQEKK